MRSLSRAAQLLVPFAAVTLTIASCGRTQLPGERQEITGQPACRADGQACSSDGDCCARDCSGGTCNPANCAKQGQSCATGCCGGLSCVADQCEAPGCYPPGNQCNFDASCCSDICGPSGTCAAACLNKGTKCTKSSQCCESSCEGGVCVGHTARLRLPESSGRSRPGRRPVPGFARRER